MEQWIYANFGWILIGLFVVLVILGVIVNMSLKDNNKNDKPHRSPTDSQGGNGMN